MVIRLVEVFDKRAKLPPINSNNVIDVLSDLFILRGVLAHMRLDDVPIILTAGQASIAAVGTQTTYLTQGSPWAKCWWEAGFQ
jgi:putative transposase